MVRKRPVQMLLAVVAFLGVHTWLAFLVVKLQRYASGDIGLYDQWVSQGINTGRWPGLTFSWVYPQAALLPMRAAAVFSHLSLAASGWVVNGNLLLTDSQTQGYAFTWCGLVALLNAIACLVFLAHFGWSKGKWGVFAWLAFMLVLGPLAMSRIDATVVPLMIMGLSLAFSRPWLATALLTLGAWIKISPAAMVIAMFAVLKHRIRNVIIPALVTTGIIVGVYYALAGPQGSLIGFLTNQGDRSLQVESFFAPPAVLMRLIHHKTAGTFNWSIRTYEVSGSLSGPLGIVATILLPIALIVIAIIAYRARTLGFRTLVLASYTLVYSMVIFNKVGSPQFENWAIAAVVVGLMVKEDRRLWLTLGGLTFLAGGLTQILYPVGYNMFLNGNIIMFAEIVTRDLVVITAFVYALRALWSFARGRANTLDEAHTARRAQAV